MKLETFLRLAEVPYRSDFQYYMSAKGKCPWITMNGEDVADSELAMRHVARVTGRDPDSSLSEKAREWGINEKEWNGDNTFGAIRKSCSVNVDV